MDRRLFLPSSLVIAVMVAGSGRGAQGSQPQSRTENGSLVAIVQTSHAHIVAQASSKARITVGRARLPINYPGMGAVLEAPGVTAPVLTAAGAIAMCSTPHYGVSCEVGPPASATLGTLVDAGMGIEDELVWALTWTSVNCELMGPPNRPAPGPLVNDVTGCEFVTFIDATSGSNPETIRGPQGVQLAATAPAPTPEHAPLPIVGRHRWSPSGRMPTGPLLS